MKRGTTALVGITALMLWAGAVVAQPPGRGGGPPGAQPGPGGGPQGRGMGPGMMMSPLLAALDADGDGELSAKEINSAVAALKKLDKNGDGKVDREEMGPPFGPPGQGGMGGGFGPGGMGPGGMGPGGFGQGGPGQGGMGQGGMGPGGFGQGGMGGGFGQGGMGGANLQLIVERIMSFDRNGDNKVDKDEMPQPMQLLLQRADANNDGAIDRQEAARMAGGGQAPRGPAGFGGGGAGAGAGRGGGPGGGPGGRGGPRR